MYLENCFISKFEKLSTQFMEPFQFYSDRISQFEHERRVFADYVALVTPSNGDLHMLEWENRQNDEQKEYFQEHVVKKVDAELKRANDMLEGSRDDLDHSRSSQKNRFSQISALSDLTQPVQRDTTYIYPDRYAGKNMQDKSLKNNAPECEISRPVIRHVKNGAILKLESELENVTRKCTGAISRLFSTISLVEEKARNISSAGSSEVMERKEAIGRQIDEVDRLDHQCFLSVCELLRLRLSIMESQRQEVEELHKLRTNEAYFIAKEKQTKDQLAIDLEAMRLRMKAELTDNTRDLRNQMFSINKRIRNMKIREKKLLEDETDVSAGITKLRAEVAKIKEKYDKSQRRHTLEMEGFHSEASLLRQRLSQLRRVHSAQERIRNRNCEKSSL